MFAGALGLFGIACTGGRPEVEDSWLARVPKENLGSVDQARATHRQAQDDVARSELARRDAERMLDVADHERDAANAKVKASKAALNAALSKGQLEGQQAAQGELEEAERVLAASEAKVQWRQEQIRAQHFEKQWRERLADAAQAELSLAEYQALKQSNDVRANQLSEAEFREAITKAQQEAAKERLEVERQYQDARNAYARWAQMQQQLEGYGGSGPPAP